MSSIFIIFTFLCIIFGGISWIFPKLLTWFCLRKYQIKVEIGRIGLPYFILHDICISRSGFSIYIEKIYFRSSFFSSEVTKILSVIVKDVRINKDISRYSSEDKSLVSNKLSFHNQKIPPAILTFVQFMAVHIYNVSGIFLRKESPEWLIHINAAELHLDGSIIHNARTLLVNISISSTTTKLLRHALQTNPQTCLAELSFGILLEGTIIAQGPLSVEKLYVEVENVKSVINDGLYKFIQRSEEKDDKMKFDNSLHSSKENIFFKFFPLIPKNFTVKVGNSTLNGMGEDNRLDFSSGLQCLMLNTQVNQSTSLKPVKEPPTQLPQSFLSLVIDNFYVKCNRENLVEMNKLTIDGKYEESVLFIYLALNTLCVSYHHCLLQPWVVYNFLQSNITRGNSTGNSLKSQNIVKNVSWFESFCNSCQISGRVELQKVSFWLHLPGEPTLTSIGFSRTEILLDRMPDFRGSTYDSPLGKLFFADKHWNLEWITELFWCKMNSSLLNADPPMLKKYHTWGTPVFAGVTMIKARSQGPAEIKFNAMVDLLRLEWSPLISQLALQILKCISEYGLNLKRKKKLAETKENFYFTISITWNNVNLFFNVNKKVCLMARLDKINIEKHRAKLGIVVEGSKMSSLTPSAIQYSCVKSDEMKSMYAHIKLARISFKFANRELSVQLHEQIQLKWCANLHLKMLTLVSEVTQSLKNFKSESNIKEPTDFPPKNEKSIGWLLGIKGDIELYVTTGSSHEIIFALNDIMAGNTSSYVGAETSKLRVIVDGAQILALESIQFYSITDDPEIQIERKKTEGLILEKNKIWSIVIDSFKATFPHEHNYADAIQNEFVTLWKWLKLMHKKKKASFTVDSQLPPDLLVKVKDFLFEMSDDAFEVKLRDNYELLEDEYQESLKREQMLDAKVAELSKTHFSMPASKIEELYESLRRKNAEIYIQRSKQISRQSPPRTRLLAWLLSDVRIISLADPSIHGAENVVKVMTEVDPESLWPEEGIEFSTLWCRSISASCSEWKVQLRDFPQPFVDIKSFHIFGRLCGAEQEAPKRAKREVTIDLGEPFGELIIERSMTALKFFHDFNCNVEYLSYAFGPCWEPVIAQCNLSFEKISPPSKDPSPPLPFWDKMRLLFHGRLTMFVHQLTMLLHASLDPYNTTEEMELKWTKVAMDWTNAKVIFQGDFDVNVKTASKYDDRRLLHLPNVKLTLKMHWVCLADPNDHHTVMPCAPDKLPEYSSNQEHDSFRAFRSQSLNVSLSLETKPLTNPAGFEFDWPNASLFGSTLRWCENLKLILSGVTRPTKRGPLFRNIRPRKKALSRHYRKVRILLGFHRFQVYYWMSFAKQIGFELLGGRITFNSEHMLNIIPSNDVLKHRPRAEWSVMCMNCDLNEVEIWLKSALQGNGNDVLSLTQPVEKCYCLSVAKVSYVRETVLHQRAADILNTSERNASCKDTPTHKLVVYDLKGAWTKKNRDIAFALFDAFMKNKQLKKNLSTESLKQFRGDSANKSRAPKLNDSLTANALATASPSPMTKAQSGNAALMLQQLISEVGNKPEAFSDDLSAQSSGQQLQGLQACQEDDVVHKNWLIALVNSQVLLKGCDTKGYVILSAAKAEILQRIHNPVWKDGTLVSKTTWMGTLECMQYYATVAAGESDKIDENIMWVTVDNIQEKDNSAAVISDLPDVPHLVGSGQSVGGVVTETVGASSIDEGKCPVQLQRIVSRCKCEFFYARYGDTSIDPNTLEEVPPMPIEENSPWEKRETAVDAFTLMHHDLNVCTNSLQYAMILDIVNHLMLYVDPKRKELYERLQRMRFQLALHSTDDQRGPIQELQNQVRSLVANLRHLEKATYLLQKQLAEDLSKELIMEIKNLNQEVFECKELLTNQSEELDMMLSCYKESQLSANQRLSTTKGDAPVKAVRANEIVFKYAKWRLTEADGQLGIADLVLTNFLYTKNSKSDDSVEHLLELDYVRMTNLLPNQVYTEVLTPSEIQSNMPIDRKRSVRVYCREKAPVGGISVKEHFEINVAPLTIGLTKKFYNTMVAFCFPGRDPDTIEGENLDDVDEQQKGSKKSKGGNKKGKETNFYVKIDDDVEKMKERAEKNKLFIYIKIPEVPVRVSYKGSKEKNLEDIRDFSLVIPTLEYHNVTWTWLDLLLAMKTDSRRVILSQAIKQKLQIKSSKGNKEEGSPQEEDKARMLLGRIGPTAGEKSLKRGIFKPRK